VPLGLRIKSTKSGEPRYFVLDEFAIEFLTHHREEQLKDKVKFGDAYPTDLNLVFCLPVVSERLRHADPNITLSVYSHALPTDTRAASKAWHNALAEAISETRKPQSDRRNPAHGKSLTKSRKLAVSGL
jgi:hypothetical protein